MDTLRLSYPTGGETDICPALAEVSSPELMLTVRIAVGSIDENGMPIWMQGTIVGVAAGLITVPPLLGTRVDLEVLPFGVMVREA